MKLKIKTYSSLTPEEIDLLARLEYEGKEVYAREDIVSFCGGERNANYLIRRLLVKNRLRTIVKNVYLFIPMKAPQGKWAANEYVIAKALARGANYYIGYSSAFNSYGFTDQMAQMIHVVNEKYSFMKTIGGIRYKLIKVLSDRIYGVESRSINGEDVVFASRERSLIDAFDFYDVKKAYDILAEQLGRMNMPLLLDHVARYPVQLVRRRMGYFLGRLGVAEELLKKIDAGMKGYSFLYDSEPQKGKTDRRWRVIVNG
jgi:predicted transcriptional regulator of viral defense system